MHSPESVYDEIGDANAAVTPHRYTAGHEKGYENGIYNVNWVYVTPEGMPFVAEWAHLCLDWCFYRHSLGRFGDQKYLDTLVPKYHIHSIAHKGCNLAPWNQRRHQYEMKDGVLYVDEYPVVLYHCHEFDWSIYKLTDWSINPDVKWYIYKPYVEMYEQIERELSGQLSVA